jgi:hypothetical protein
MGDFIRNAGTCALYEPTMRRHVAPDSGRQNYDNSKNRHQGRILPHYRLHDSNLPNDNYASLSGRRQLSARRRNCLTNLSMESASLAKNAAP